TATSAAAHANVVAQTRLQLLALGTAEPRRTLPVAPKCDRVVRSIVMKLTLIAVFARHGDGGQTNAGTAWLAATIAKPELDPAIDLLCTDCESWLVEDIRVPVGLRLRLR